MIFVSNAEPQRLAVIASPVPTKVYQTPGAVIDKDGPQTGAVSIVAVAVDPVSVAPQVIAIAFEQSSLTGWAKDFKQEKTTKTNRSSILFIFECFNCFIKI